MRIVKAIIINILGIEHEVFEFKKFNAFLGDNKTGKSSALNALKWAFRAKNDHVPSMLRGYDWPPEKNPPQEGSIQVFFDDNNVLTSTVTREKSTHEFTGHKHAGKYISEIVDIAAFNPTAFVYAPPDKRLKMMLSVMPLNVDYDLIDNTLGLKVSRSGNPIETLDYWIEKVNEDKKKAINYAEDREASYRDISRSLPLEDPEAPEQTIATLEAQKSEAENDAKSRQKDVEGNRDNLKAKALSKKDIAKAEADRIHREALAAAEQEYNKEMETITTSFNSESSFIQQTLSDSLSPINESLGKAREYMRNYDTIMAQRTLALDKKKEGEEYREEALMNKKLIENLKTIKRTFISSIPIEGLDMRDGEIYVDDVVWPDVNSAKQLEIAGIINSWAANEKELPIIGMDKMEQMGDIVFDAFEANAKKTRAQYFVAKRTEGPLTLKASD